MMNDKDNQAFKDELDRLYKQHGPLNTRDLMLISTAWADGRDAHAERVKPLIEAARRLESLNRTPVIMSVERSVVYGEVIDAARSVCSAVRGLDAIQQPAESAEPANREGKE